MTKSNEPNTYDNSWLLNTMIGDLTILSDNDLKLLRKQIYKEELRRNGHNVNRGSY